MSEKESAGRLGLGELLRDIMPYEVYQTVVARQYDIYLNQAVEEPRHYSKLIDLFRNASSQDSINVFLNTPGGVLHTGVQLIGAMKDCQARVTTVLDGTAQSLGPLILFAGHDIVINDNAMIMFHNYSGHSFGKGNETREAQRAYDKMYLNLLETHARPFLSDEEIQRVINGEDMYFVGEEIQPRIEAVVKLRREELAEAVKKAGFNLMFTEDGQAIPYMKDPEQKETQNAPEEPAKKKPVRKRKVKED